MLRSCFSKIGLIKDIMNFVGEEIKGTSTKESIQDLLPNM